MRISILFFLALSAFAQMRRLYPAPAPTAPPGFEYVDYVDETGQTVPVLVQTPVKPTKVIVNDCPGCQKTAPLMEFEAIDYEVTNTAGTITASIDPAERYFSLQETDPAFTSPYLKVEVDEGYAPKSITIRVDGKDVKMDWVEFEQMVRWYHHKDRLVWETEDGKEIR